ncbi:hypothetical protein PRUPE_1G010800 [Prunus persica]|uniref:Uncharacterized protein n=1 Tax=Prunus persica TaxID=3760 RepID=A0A251QR41_PRUPE|nr:hypothetical protein PRUPE_1G010800 [Prunus persica]
MQCLTKLVTCPGLGGRSALLSGPEWHKISHIPCISVDPLPLRTANLLRAFFFKW